MNPAVPPVEDVVDDPVGTVTDAADEVAGDVGDTVSETVGDAGDTVEQATQTVTDALPQPVQDTVEQVTTPVNNVLGTVTKTAGDTVGKTVGTSPSGGGAATKGGGSAVAAGDGVAAAGAAKADAGTEPSPAQNGSGRPNPPGQTGLIGVRQTASPSSTGLASGSSRAATDGQLGRNDPSAALSTSQHLMWALPGDADRSQGAPERPAAPGLPLPSFPAGGLSAAVPAGGAAGAALIALLLATFVVAVPRAGRRHRPGPILGWPPALLSALERPG